MSRCVLRYLALFLMTSSLVACSSLQRFPTTLDEVAQSAPAQRSLGIEQWQTEAGSKVLFVPSPNLPIVDVRLVFDGGSARDGDLPGLASMTSALIGEGAKGLSVDDIARGFEDLGVNFGSSSYRDMAVVEMRSLSDSEYLDPALDLFAQVVGKADFPARSLERIRTQRLTGLQQDKQVPGPQVGKAFHRVLFGEHPYGHPSSGTEDSVVRIQRADLVNFWRNYYTAGNTVIAVTGDLSRAEAQALAARLSNALPAGGAAPALPKAEPLPARKVEHLEFDSAQTIVLMGNQSIWRGHPDWVPLYVGNHILGGGGFGSILTDVVREEKGYVYGIGSGFSPMAAAGPFTVQFSTGNDNAEDALKVTLGLIRDFVENGPTQKQLNDAVANIVGSFPLRNSENDEIVGQLGAIGFYDLPQDYLQWFEAQVRQVTVEEVRAAFQRNVDPATLAIVTIGPEAPLDPTR